MKTRLFLIMHVESTDLDQPCETETGNLRFLCPGNAPFRTGIDGNGHTQHKTAIVDRNDDMNGRQEWHFFR